MKRLERTARRFVPWGWWNPVTLLPWVTLSLTTIMAEAFLPTFSDLWVSNVVSSSALGSKQQTWELLDEPAFAGLQLRTPSPSLPYLRLSALFLLHSFLSFPRPLHDMTPTSFIPCRTHLLTTYCVPCSVLDSEDSVARIPSQVTYTSVVQCLPGKGKPSAPSNANNSQNLKKKIQTLVRWLGRCKRWLLSCDTHPSRCHTPFPQWQDIGRLILGRPSQRSEIRSAIA